MTLREFWNRDVELGCEVDQTTSNADWNSHAVTASLCFGHGLEFPREQHPWASGR